MGAGAHLEICYATYVHKQGRARDGMGARKNAAPFGERVSAWQYPSSETVSHRDANVLNHDHVKMRSPERPLLQMSGELKHPEN